MSENLRLVWGTRTNKWHLIDANDRDFETAIKLNEADEISPEDLEAAADYWDRLKPSFLGGPCENPMQSFNDHECFDCKMDCPIGGDK